MSRLETNNKSILAPLICDSPLALDFIQQSGIAIWTIKTAMVFECTKGAANIDNDNRDVFYSAADRHHLLKWSTPPPDTFVWIGRYEDDFSLWVQNDRVSNAEPKNVLSEGSVTTFAMGRLVVQAITTRRAQISDEKTRGRIRAGKGQWDEMLIQVWPEADHFVRWPPSRSVTGLEHLEELARRFGRRRSSEPVEVK